MYTFSLYIYVNEKKSKHIIYIILLISINIKM